MAESGFNHWNQLANALESAAKQVVKKVALDVQADAQSLAPVDIGFLKNSIYTVTSTGAHGAPSGDQAFPTVAAPDDETTAYVAVGALYGEYVEEGTRFTEPQPYFYQAMEWGQGALDDAIGRIQDRLEEAAQ